MLGIALLEALVLCAVALALGWPLSLVFAQAIGRTRTFLNFSAASDMQAQMSPSVLRFGLAMAAVALDDPVDPYAERGPAYDHHLQAGTGTLAARAWWQRAWLDVLLLILTGYGIYLLRKQGAIAVAGSGARDREPRGRSE